MGLWQNIVKAVRGDQIPTTLSLPSPEEIDARIAQDKPLPYKASESPEYKDIDPLDTWNNIPPETQGRQHPGTEGKSLSYDVLDLLASVPMVQAIISTRINQWAEYAKPQRSRFDVGYRIQLRDPRQKTTEAAQKRALELSRWLYTCGDPRLNETPSFEHWMRKVARDSLVYDQLCSEIVYASNGKPAGFVAVDAKTIRRARLTNAERNELRRDQHAGYVQVLNNIVQATWDQQHFIFGVRNPRTGVQFAGYGHPELEQAALTITHLVNATTYNAANFTNGIHAAGVLAISAAMNEATFRQSERKLRAMMTGAQNANRALVMKLDPNLKESVEWHSLTNNNKEMEYGKWIDFLVKVVCSCFQMDPAELGFTFAAGSMLGASNATADRVAASKERGLRPNVRFVESLLNTRIIHQLDEDFELSLDGFDPASEAVKLEHYNKAVRSYMTVNEVRALEMLPAFDTEPASNGPIDGVYQSAVQNAKNMALQQEQMQQAQEQQQAAMGMAAPVGVEQPNPDMALPEDADEMDEDSLPDLSEEDLAAMFENPEDMQKAVKTRKKVMASLDEWEF